MPMRRVYPRVCGGTRDDVRVLAASDGLSPRMRGNRSIVSHTQPCSGSIPAYAGEPRIATNCCGT